MISHYAATVETNSPLPKALSVQLLYVPQLQCIELLCNTTLGAPSWCPALLVFRATLIRHLM